MKALFTAIFCIFFGANVIPAEPDKDALKKLAAHIGKTFWSPPEKRLVRATTYQKGKDGSGSRKNISNATISLLRYATAKEAGTIAVPQWLPRGSMVRARLPRFSFPLTKATRTLKLLKAAIAASCASRASGDKPSRISCSILRNPSRRCSGGGS
ncbi:MAG TPA: hypothetical protein VGH37_05440 [Candidatus Acidoferrum sp.]|jgi:hypothetical protein